MNLLRLTLSYVRSRPLNTLLNILLLALGIATIVVLLLFSRQVEGNLTRNAEGIDLVVGAKGSPLQLILSSVYHIDAPTGNIPMQEAEMIRQNPAVAESIPLALGDSYEGYRIVGSTPAYAERYDAEVAQGALWGGTYEVTLGAAVAAETGLGVGDKVVSAHGLSEGGQEHGAQPLEVAGILAPSGTVLDRLILTSIETVWAVHETHAPEEEAGEAAAEHDGHDDGAASGTPATPAPPTPQARPQMPMMGPGGMQMGGGSGGREYTALLVTYSSPLAKVMFPRFINAQTNLQAADPADQIVRLNALLGVGFQALRAFAGVLIFAAALGVFIALYNALKERRYDLAIMRSLGASRGKLMMHVLLEGVLLALAGTVLGLFLGHLATELLGAYAEEAQGIAVTGWTWVPGEAWLFVLALGVGLVAALLPAVQAYRTEIATTLVRS